MHLKFGFIKKHRNSIIKYTVWAILSFSVHFLASAFQAHQDQPALAREPIFSNTAAPNVKDISLRFNQDGKSGQILFENEALAIQLSGDHVTDIQLRQVNGEVVISVTYVVPNGIPAGNGLLVSSSR
jgi:hypothetical protein